MSLLDELYEDYASAPVDGGFYVTLEFLHSAFLYQGLSGVIRLVKGFESISAALEDSAPLNAGEAVEFLPAPLDIVPPKIDDQGVQALNLTLDGITMEAVEQLERQAAAPREPIILIYRVYLASDLSAPAQRFKFTLKQPRVSGVTFTAQAVFSDPVNRRFPSIDFTLSDFPGLA